MQSGRGQFIGLEIAYLNESTSWHMDGLCRCYAQNQGCIAEILADFFKRIIFDRVTNAEIARNPLSKFPMTTSCLPLMGDSRYLRCIAVLR